MKTFNKMLKKLTIPLIFVIALLVFQAICDLSLPTYTSNIVNVGIQQGGVESSVPFVIRESELEHISLFLDEDSKDVLDNYTLISKDSLSDAKYKEYSKDYPLLETENLYVLKDNISDEEMDTIKEKLTEPMLITYFLSSDLAESSDNKVPNNTTMMSQLPKDMTVFDFLKVAPAEQVAAIKEDVQEKLNDLDDAMKDQFAINYVKAEYEEIGVDLDKMQSDFIVHIGIQMLLVSFGAMVATVLVTLIGARMGTSFARDLRSKIFEKVLGFSNNELNKFSTASLITRCTNDIQQIQTLFVMMTRMIFYAPIVGIGAFIKVLNSGREMSWVIGVAVLSMLVLIATLMILAMPKFQVVQKMVDKVNLVSREILTGLPVIRAFSTERHEEKRFDDANKDLTKVNLFVNRVMTIMMPSMMLIMNGISILIIWVGAKVVEEGNMQVGDLMAFIQYTMQIIIAFLMLSMMSIVLPRAIVSVKRINEIFNTELTILEPEKSVDFPKDSKGLLEFKNVSFKYESAPEDALMNISFTAKPGETTAIIGSTGCGKSTLLNLIPRLYDVTSGEILIDGVNIKSVSQKVLRTRLGYVPQKGMLFSGTIKSNILYGNESGSIEEMETAAKVAQALDFINEKPEKFEDRIAQEGGNVSGGQKQRLSIARAIAKKPDIYLFDDSFSALDFKTDSTLRQALKKHTKESTILVVAQRISTVLNADQIIVLDDGKIVGIGTHKELLKNCEVYQDIAYSQLSEAELSIGGV